MCALPSPLADIYVRFPGLSRLADDYLVNWDYMYGSVEAAVADFVVDHGSMVSSALEGITYIRDAVPAATRVEALQAARFPYVPPTPDDLESFLDVLAARLEDAIP